MCGLGQHKMLYVNRGFWLSPAVCFDEVLGLPPSPAPMGASLVGTHQHRKAGLADLGFANRSDFSRTVTMHNMIKHGDPD